MLVPMEMNSAEHPARHRRQSLAVLTVSLVAALPVLAGLTLVVSHGVGSAARGEQPVRALGTVGLSLTGSVLGLLAAGLVIRYSKVRRMDGIAKVALLAVGLCIGTYGEFLVPYLMMDLPAFEPEQAPPGWTPYTGPVPPELPLLPDPAAS
ncbi:hypothetical protein ASC99_15745 [Kitasatospora sp. Root107]|nr:hypothetical protein ASC99_15745 [Kitasatospora sp. Root107]